MSQPPDPFEFLKSLWGPMGLPLPGSMGLGPDTREIDKRIAELKSVENWLNVNLNVLRTAVHTLEMQRSGLAAMQEAPGAARAESAPASTTRNPAAVASHAPGKVKQRTPSRARDPSKR